MNNDNWAVGVRRMKIEMRPGDNKVYTFLLKGREEGGYPHVQKYERYRNFHITTINPFNFFHL